MIKVPYEEMFSRSRTIQQQAELVRAEVQKLDNEVQSLEWMGQRASKFQETWQSARPFMLEWATTLETFASELHDKATRMKNADTNF